MVGGSSFGFSEGVGIVKQKLGSMDYSLGFTSFVALMRSGVGKNSGIEKLK